MKKRFYAINRQTGEKWKPEPSLKNYLVMYDSGYLAVVTEGFYTHIEPLCTKTWKKITIVEKPTNQ